MYVTVPKTVDINDIAVDVETALSVVRSLYTGYFEDLPENEKGAFTFYARKDEIQQFLGVVIDYMRSAQALIAAYDEQQK